MLYVALQKSFPKSRLRIEHSMSKGFYFRVNRKLSHADLMTIEKTMTRMVEKDISIKKMNYPKYKALKLFKRIGLKDKVMLLENIRKKRIKIYSLLNFYDMYAIPPLDSTGQINLFYLEMFPPGFILMFPVWQNLTHLPRYVPQPKLTRIFNEYGEWARILGIDNVGQLNSRVRNGEGPEIIKICEALHEKKIVYIADRILKNKKKIILIAGPSSAGKTTFTKRLAIQLRVNGMKPLIISADNYFLPHSKTPRDKSGRLDFESIDAVDIALLNKHLFRIIQGKKTTLPKFNFLTGRRNEGRRVLLPNDGIILLEGIHCLNEDFTYKIPKPIKFKIYISALTHLNIDDHNRISTTDTRMLRRIVRDTYFRGHKIKSILRHWGSVRNGEEKNIYPFQEEADEMFNSALIYEPAVLKKFCLPIIKRIQKGSPEYVEAERLLEFFSLFYELGERDVPSNSILREFIGGSSFVY
jgi:uridine kinase